jgi:alanine racemase
MATACATTPAATRRADVSLTGLGKLKNRERMVRIVDPEFRSDNSGLAGTGCSTRHTTTVATMTVRLTVRSTAWQQHVADTAAAYGGGLVPVVKGNGYGFGRSELYQRVIDGGGRWVCVGSLHELPGVPDALTPVVLTPTLTPPPTLTADIRAVLTVGHPAHVEVLQGWHGRVMVKLGSSMQRYGASPRELPALLHTIERAGLQVEAFALHLPLAGTDLDRLAELEAWLPHLDADTPLWVSHLAPASFHELAARHPRRPWRVRVGTTLWHGVPRGDFVQLTAEVVQTHPVTAGTPVGYRLHPAPFDGTVVAIAAGAAQGVAQLEGVDPAHASPFHFEHRRLVLLEPPHMHTSLAIVPTGQPCPAVGDRVDVQRPLISTLVDEIEWT